MNELRGLKWLALTEKLNDFYVLKLSNGTPHSLMETVPFFLILSLIK